MASSAAPKEILEFSARSIQRGVGGSEVGDQPGELVLLRTSEAAELLFRGEQHPTQKFFKWAYRHRVPGYYVGRSRRWDRRVILDFLERKPWTRRRV